MSIFSLSFSAGFFEMLIRFIICTIVNWVIVDRLYFKKSQRRDFYFTFLLIGVAIFFVVFFMIFVLEDMKGKTGIGIGIGLFGIFSIMRYRTEQMPVREMTYLFVLICLSVVNALATNMSIVELLVTNLIVVTAVWLCEKKLKVEPYKYVQYDRIELVKPERREDLLADLRERLGLDVYRVEMGGVDFLRDMAVLKVFYHDDDFKGHKGPENLIKLRRTEMMETES